MRPNGGGDGTQISTNGANLPLVANGHKSPSTNGAITTNGKSRTPYGGHDREEVSRILIQALTDLGYHGAAAAMSQESGYDLESPTVAAFRHAVLHGDWSEAEFLLFGGPPDEGGVSLSRNALLLRDDADPTWMRFWLREQKFLELLEQRDTGSALMVLRTELTPLSQDTAKLHALSSLLMCQSAEHVKARANWDGAHGQSRSNLLSALSKCIDPTVMLPEHRLAVLFNQVKNQQISACLYHNSTKSPSLYTHHTCGQEDFPLHIICALQDGDGDGEYWVCEFSHDGNKVAVAGSNGVLWIYDIKNFSQEQDISGHDEGIVSIAWSPDDSVILTCSQDRTLRWFNTQTGGEMGYLPKFGQPCSSCAWSPDGQSFVVGCLEKERNLCQYDLHGDMVYDWGRSHRVQDLAISADGRWLVAMGTEKRVYVYNFMTREAEYELEMDAKLASVAISADSRSLLIKKHDGEIRLLDIETQAVKKDYASMIQPSTMVIRAAFGGANDSFVVTGSEQGNIYIWHRESGMLVEKLVGHRAACNTIAWNPANPTMFASCGDDGTLRIWSSRRATEDDVHSNGAGSERGSIDW